MLIDLLSSGFGLIIIVLVILSQAVKITREYERGVIFRLGRFAGIRGPGLFLIIPIIDKLVKLDLRIITLDVPAQDVITKDNIPIKVDAVLYFKISDPGKATIEVENYMMATSQNSQTSLRGVVGASTLDELLAEREKINQKLHEIIDKATDPWGIKVTAVEVKHVEIPENMQRAIAKQAEAERMKRAKIILAEGEYLAAQKLKEAGDILKADPIVLRYLETLTEAAKEKNTTILFPVEMLGMLKRIQKQE
ncbi:slipin family protein [Patescibacteria group bacterium]|nr:slipin family protein [Patescibacteria group bacterium]MBU4481245.1 slipin family protein [Patescibacteria group bacterium]